MDVEVLSSKKKHWLEKYIRYVVHHVLCKDIGQNCLQDMNRKV